MSTAEIVFISQYTPRAWLFRSDILVTFLFRLNTPYIVEHVSVFSFFILPLYTLFCLQFNYAAFMYPPKSLPNVTSKHLWNAPFLLIISPIAIISHVLSTPSSPSEKANYSWMSPYEHLYYTEISLLRTVHLVRKRPKFTDTLPL